MRRCAPSPPCLAAGVHQICRGPSPSVSTLRVARRFQSFIGEQRSVARVSKSSYRHPLAPKDPAQRNVTIPTTASRAAASSGSSSSFPGATAASVSAEDLKKQAQKALLLQMQQEVLWEGTVIDDTTHSLVQHFVKLSTNDKYRQARHMLVVGGRAMIEELCHAGHRPRHLMVEAGRPIPEWARDRRDTDVVLVDRHVSAAVAKGTDGYVGDFDIPTPPMKEQLIANHQRLNRVLVLDNVDDPGVLGTLLRTASGYQYDAIITTNHCADLYDHRVVRAARGAHFQTSVPIYTLKEEDGDDVYGLLNHVAQRNNLAPLCFTAQDDASDDDAAGGAAHSHFVSSPAAPGGRVFHSSVVGAAPVPLPAPRQDRATPYAAASSSTLGSAAAAAPHSAAVPLSSFCLDRFAHRDSAEEDAQSGYMLFAGPNHKRNMVRRLTERVSRPTTQLLLDSLPSPSESPSDLLVSLSVVLYSLRPRGNWDYLPVEAKEERSSVDLQTKCASVDIGANRLRVSAADINDDEAEQREKAHEANEFRRWRRLAPRRDSDYDHWMDAEQRRVQAMVKRERQQRVAPWLASKNTKTHSMPDWVPNIIDEYRQSLDRDALVHERDISSHYTRPPQ
ncbi:SpoU rRNA Methylase family [Novymonas esmeraldas]|uniref:SpoU rRNA Methylase family n=1 Tax=Novymonas esmeraldas TaxID=1808958 RepID=A0AAW0F672_9TRYP